MSAFDKLISFLDVRVDPPVRTVPEEITTEVDRHFFVVVVVVCFCLVLPVAGHRISLPQVNVALLPGTVC